MSKKNILAFISVLVFTASFVFGCGSKNADPVKTSSGEFIYQKYITLGDYKNLEVTQKNTIISDEEVENLKKEYLDTYAEHNPKTTGIEMGDDVSVSVRAYADSELVYDFYGEDDCYDLIVGDKEFGEEFDKKLLGMTAGEESEFTISFGLEEEDAAFSGKEVLFQIKIESANSIVYPDVTDEFVQEEFECASVLEWNEKLKKELQDEAEAEALSQLRINIGDALVEASTFNGYPEDLYKSMYNAYMSDFQSYAEFFDTDLAGVYEMFGVTEDEVKEDAIKDTKAKVAILNVAYIENISLSDEEYLEQEAKFMEENEYYDEEELYEDYTKEELSDSFLSNKIYDFLIENAKITTVMAN